MQGKASKAKRRRRALGLDPPKNPERQATGAVGDLIRREIIPREAIPQARGFFKAVVERGQPLVRARRAVERSAPSAVATIVTLMRDKTQRGEVRLAAARTIGEWAGVPADGASDVSDIDLRELVALKDQIKQELKTRVIDGEATVIRAGSPGQPDPDASQDVESTGLTDQSSGG